MRFRTVWRPACGEGVQACWLASGRGAAGQQDHLRERPAERPASIQRALGIFRNTRARSSTKTSLADTAGETQLPLPTSNSQGESCDSAVLDDENAAAKAAPKSKGKHNKTAKLAKARSERKLLEAAAKEAHEEREALRLQEENAVVELTSLLATRTELVCQRKHLVKPFGVLSVGACSPVSCFI